MCRVSLVNPHPHYISGQTYSDAIRNIPHSLDPDSFIEPYISVNNWSPYLLRGKFSDFFECQRGTLLEAHLDVFANVDGVFLDHHFIDSRTALLLAILLCGSNSAEPKLEKTPFLMFSFTYAILLCLRLKSSHIAQVHLKLLDLSQPPT